MSDKDGITGPDLLPATVVTALMVALTSGAPHTAAEALLGAREVDPELADTLVATVRSDRPPAEIAIAIGDVIRSQDPAGRAAANEFYRAAFYLGDGWQKAVHNPLFARFAANKAGQPYDKWVHYFDIYQRTLQPFVGTDARVLEIGVFHGGGLDQLAFLLGPNARLVGVDVDHTAAAACGDRFPVAVGDQADPDFLAAVVAEHGPFDVIIDDGGHTMKQQIGSIETLFPTLAPDGVYLVEDTHTSYLSEYQDGPTTFMEWTKNRLDDLNAYHHSRDRELPLWATDVSGIHVYDSIVVFDKNGHPPPFAEVVGVGTALQAERSQDLTLLFQQATINARTAEAVSDRRAAAQARAELAQASEILARTQAELAASRDELARVDEALERNHAVLRALRETRTWRWSTAARSAARRVRRDLS